MARYRIAGYVVDIFPRYPLLTELCADYACDEAGAADFTLRVSDEELAAEGALADGQHSPAFLEAVAAYRKLCYAIPTRGGMMLHGAAIAVAGRGIMFLAKSGVGKSTHVLQWQERFREAVTVINGDKPILRFESGEPTVCGTPWAGKEHWQTNLSVPLCDLCFLERAGTDFCLPITAKEAVKRITPQLTLPPTLNAAAGTLEMLDMLLRHCRLWRVGCTPTPHAAEAVYKALWEGL